MIDIDRKLKIFNLNEDKKMYRKTAGKNIQA